MSKTPASLVKDRLQSTARLWDYVRELGGHRSGAVTRPRVLTHTVSFRCNARCVMCDSWRIERQDELSTEEIGAFYRQLPRLDALRLTGGEPFVRKDLAEIAHLGAELLKPRLVHLTTNGFLTDRILEFARSWDQRASLHVLVSLDGLAGLRRRLLGETGPASPSCAALHSHLRLFPNGDVPTCQNSSRVIGNVRENTFAEIWESALAGSQRKWVKACAGCWSECEVLPSAIYSGDLPAFALRRTFRPPSLATAKPRLQRSETK